MGDIFTTKHVNDAMNKEIAEARPIAKAEDLQKALPIHDSLRYESMMGTSMILCVSLKFLCEKF